MCEFFFIIDTINVVSLSHSHIKDSNDKTCVRTSKLTSMIASQRRNPSTWSIPGLIEEIAGRMRFIISNNLLFITFHRL